MRSVRVTTAEGRFGQIVRVGSHEWRADEPPDLGGDDTGPDPHELVLAGLGACTSMIIRAYAHRKGWPLLSVDVRVSGRREGSGFVIGRAIHLTGDLDAEQRARLLEIADDCPVAKTLSGPITVRSRLV